VTDELQNADSERNLIMLFVFVNSEMLSYYFGLYYKLVYICKEANKYMRSAF